MTIDPNLPWSEQFRLTGQAWVEADGAARLLEDTKSAFLSQLMNDTGISAVAAAEREVKGSKTWMDFVNRMVEARTKANLLKVEMEFTRMKFSEWQSLEASARTEQRLIR